MPVRRKNQPESTQKKPAKSKKTNSLQEAEKKRAILEGVQRSSDSVKATLKQLGLGQSTYYRWQKQYQAEGMEGLKAGGAVSDKVWNQFGALREKLEMQPVAEGKLRAQERQIMKSDNDKERMRELLFRKFDEGPSKEGEKKEARSGPSKPEAGAAPSSVSYTPPTKDPMDKMLKYGIVAFAFVVAMLVMASWSNTNNFYFKQSGDTIEVWRGRFAPLGKYRMASFSDPTIIEGLPAQSCYSKKQAYGVLSKYYIGEADRMLTQGDMPDLKGAKSYLAQASKYAVSEGTRQMIRERLGNIHRIRDNLQRYVEKP